jgi:hypothetical protein
MKIRPRGGCTGIECAVGASVTHTLLFRVYARGDKVLLYTHIVKTGIEVSATKGTRRYHSERYRVLITHIDVIYSRGRI